MINKIYLGLLIFAVLLMSFLTFYSYSWLQSIGDPKVAAENFTYFADLSWKLLWFSFIGLVAFANFLIWKNGKSWSIWASFVYFAFFIIIQTLWLAPALLSFEKLNNLTDSSFSITPIIGVMTVVVLAIAIFFNQFIMLRVREKTIGDNNNEEINE